MDPFLRFLRRETAKVKARKIGSSTFILEERVRRRRYSLPTDFIDILFLRSDPSERVTIEKSLLRELRYRLDELEKEVKRLRWKNRVLETLLALSVVMLIVSFIVR